MVSFLFLSPPPASQLSLNPLSVAVARGKGCGGEKPSSVDREILMIFFSDGNLSLW